MFVREANQVTEVSAIVHSSAEALFATLLPIYPPLRNFTDSARKFPYNERTAIGEPTIPISGETTMKTLKYALLMLALFITPAALIAQAGDAPGGGQMEAGPHTASVDDQLADLSQKLNLTDAQKPQVKTILQEQHDKMKQVMENSSASHDESRSKMRSIHEASRARIRTLLTDDQKATFDKIQGPHRHMGEKHGEGAPPPQQ